MRDEIIRMAKEAGFSEAWLTAGSNPPLFDMRAVIVERFYNLAVQHEREACAKVCEEPWQGSPKEIARQIRARGEKK